MAQLAASFIVAQLSAALDFLDAPRMRGRRSATDQQKGHVVPTRARPPFTS